jgi:hypothetical protein
MKEVYVTFNKLGELDLELLKGSPELVTMIKNGVVISCDNETFEELEEHVEATATGIWYVKKSPYYQHKFYFLEVMDRENLLAKIAQIKLSNGK